MRIGYFDNGAGVIVMTVRVVYQWFTWTKVKILNRILYSQKWITQVKTDSVKVMISSVVIMTILELVKFSYSYYHHHHLEPTSNTNPTSIITAAVTITTTKSNNLNRSTTKSIEKLMIDQNSYN
ncbi:hypothetical protein ACTFIU_000739 [Dictyostelium citrinum]